MVELKTKVEKVIYYNPDSNWGVLSLKSTLTGDNTFKEDTIKASGNFIGAYEGCEVHVIGDVVNHPKYGNQISITNCEVLRDNNSKESIVNFLAKSAIKGISVQNAVKIYNKYGEHSIDTVLNNADDLITINGIGQKTISKIKNSVNKYLDMKELVEYCTKLGFNYISICKIYDKLGKDAVDKIKENIYGLLDYLDNISWKQLDSIALKNGINKNDYNRVKYCILYTLKYYVAFTGSTGATFSSLKNKVLKELGNNGNNAFSAVLNKLSEESLVYQENNKIYYKYYYDLEKNISNKIKEIVDRKTECDINNSIIEEEIKNFPFTLNEGQIKTINNVLNHNISIITGLAGCGKSTILKALVNIYERSNYNVVLLSPTGKATRRIEECTGSKAHTIHKYLGVRGSVETTETREIQERSIVFIDEFSMTDVVIFNKLLESFTRDTKLVMLGDHNQLPSVSAGSLLEDMLIYNKISINILTDIMRQASNSNIIANCSKINNGEPLDEGHLFDFYYKKYENEESLLVSFLNLYDIEVKKNKGINYVQVMTPYKGGVIGTKNLNKIISDKYNKNTIDEKFGFKLGDKVMQIVNNYEKDVFNGETGIIIDINEDYLTVNFNDNLVEYEIQDMDQLILASVVTVHKCQGSEYPVVFVLIDDVNTLLLVRRILYTAVSRGKKKVYLLCKEGAANMCIDNDNYIPRVTKLSAFLNEVS